MPSTPRHSYSRKGIHYTQPHSTEGGTVVSQMQRGRGEPVAGDEHGGCTAAEGMLLRRERELMAQLHELLFPSSSSPIPADQGSGSGGASSWSSSGPNCVQAADMADECSPVVKVPAACESPALSCGGRRRRSGSKRAARDVEVDAAEELVGGGAGASATKPARCRRRKQGATTLVTTVPDFDGYQWRKYGQKHIEAANYPRSYYRCTNSTDQGCPAKRTVQRNDDGCGGGGGGPPKYTVVYIWEHTCKTDLAVAPVILETTVDRACKNPPPSTTHVNGVVVPAAAESSTSTGGSRTSESPANSDATWSGSGDTVPSEQHGDCSHVFAADGWFDWTTAEIQQGEMDLAGPIRSPVHIAAAADQYGNWSSYGLFASELSVVPSSCHLFGF